MENLALFFASFHLFWYDAMYDKKKKCAKDKTRRIRKRSIEFVFSHFFLFFARIYIIECSVYHCVLECLRRQSDLVDAVCEECEDCGVYGKYSVEPRSGRPIEKLVNMIHNDRNEFLSTCGATNECSLRIIIMKCCTNMALALEERC